MTPVQEGEVLAGKYRVERVLGVGGMGVVVAALHIALDERVAIKFLLPEALGNPEAVARFAREARAAVKIKSQHVARVSDVGVLESGAPYMVMEYLQGQDLSQRLRDGGAFAVQEAVDFVLQASEALAEAHALGMVHRDLKPANLFLTRLADGSHCVKVLDFGISKVTSPSSSGQDFGMTKTQAVMGSPLYMSPEQMASSRDVDGRTDIWALGTILYELLTGRVPFLGDTMPQLCAMILQERPPPARGFRPDLPEPLEQAVFRCLEKDRTRRFANVAELAHALLPFGSRTASRSVERISKVLTAAGISSSQLALPAPSVAPAATQASWDKTGSRTAKSGLWPVLLGAGVVIAGGAFAAWRVLKPDTAAQESLAVSSSVAAPPVPVTTPAPPPEPVVTPPPVVTPSPPPSAVTPSAPSATAVAPTPARVTRPTPRPVAQVKAPTAAKPASPAPAPPAPRPKATIDPLEGRR
jgi:eukaryotic-like serine/threonine-protein kinase